MILITHEGKVLDGSHPVTGKNIAAAIILPGDMSNKDIIDTLQQSIFTHINHDTNSAGLECFLKAALQKYQNQLQQKNEQS